MTDDVLKGNVLRGALEPSFPDTLTFLSTQSPYIDPTAKQASFQRYFHYQPFRNGHKGYLVDTLRNRRLFFSDPHNVNDPWDCRPAFDYRPMLADPAKREEFLTFGRMFLGPDMLNHPLRAQYEHLIRTDDGQFIRAMEESSRLLAENIALRRFYCLTPFADNTLMWSHYADNHRGICLEFGKDNPLIEKARTVRYCKTYPEWTHLNIVDAPLELVLTKSKDWEYEREFRIIGSLIDGTPTRLDGNFVSLPDNALKAIIIGCENRDGDEIVQMIKVHSPGLAVRRAVRVANHFKLTIESEAIA